MIMGLWLCRRMSLFSGAQPERVLISTTFNGLSKEKEKLKESKCGKILTIGGSGPRVYEGLLYYFSFL